MQITTGGLVWGGDVPSDDGLVISPAGPVGWYGSPAHRYDSVDAAGGGVLWGASSPAARTVSLSGELVATADRGLWVQRAERLAGLGGMQLVTMEVEDGGVSRMIRGRAEIKIDGSWDGGGAEVDLVLKSAAAHKLDARELVLPMVPFRSAQGGLPYPLAYPLDWDGEAGEGQLADLPGGTWDGELTIRVSGNASTWHLVHPGGVWSWTGGSGEVTIDVHRRSVRRGMAVQAWGYGGQWPSLRGTSLVLVPETGFARGEVSWRAGWV